jgi:hypothetical protein
MKGDRERERRGCGGGTGDRHYIFTRKFVEKYLV